MRTVSWILAGFLALQFAFASDSDRPQNIRELLRTEENYLTVQSPNSVEVIALTLVGDVNQYRKFDTQLFTAAEHAQLRGAPLAPPAELSSALSKKLVTNETYYWEGVKGCLPFFHLRATFTRGENAIIADFCFGCDLVYFRNGAKTLGSGDFHPSRAELLSLFRKILPKNPILEDQAALNETLKAKSSH